MVSQFSTSFIIIILLVLICTVSSIWWFVPKLQMKSASSKLQTAKAKDLISLEDEFRKTITQALGSIFVVASILFAYLQIADARQATDQQLRAARRTADTQLMSSQFAKGFDLIGSNIVAQRIGGIQVLDNWINHPLVEDGISKEQRFNLVVPALISMIRQATAFSRNTSLCEDFDRPQSARISDDVRAALRVIAPWTHQADRGTILLDSLNLSGSDLSGFDLDGVDLSYSDLSGSNLRRATFHGSRLYCTNFWSSDLTAADFSSQGQKTILSGSFLMRSKLSLTKFMSTDMRSANISEAIIDNADFTNADLFNTNFSRATITAMHVGADSDLTDACFVETTLRDTDLQLAKGFDKALFVPPHGEIDRSKSHCFSTQRHGLMVPSASQEH